MIEFIRQESKAGHHSVVKMYQILDIPRATYSRKITPIPSKRAREQELLDQRVFSIYHKNDCIYVAGKICYLLTQNYQEYGKIRIKRVQKSMRRQGLHSITIKKFKLENQLSES